MFNILFEAKSVSSEIALPREMHQYQNHTPQSFTHLHKNYVQLQNAHIIIMWMIIL